MEQFLMDNLWLVIIIGLWVLPWKAVALWRSAQRKNKWWFIALLIMNTLGLLEILYIFVFSKNKKLEGDKIE
jgi:hypothetical protein